MKPERHQRWSKAVEEYSQRLNRLEIAADDHDLGVGAGGEIPCLGVEAFADALDQVMSTRAPYNLLRQGPSITARTAGALWLRAFRWHGSGGNLHGLFSWQQDARLIHRALTDDDFLFSLRPNHWLHEAVRNTPESWAVEAVAYTEQAFVDAIDTSALIVRGGASPAAEAWGRALGRIQR